MPHPIIWFEVIGKDSSGLSKFYGDLFDWRIDAGPEGYFTVAPDGDVPLGGIGADPAGGAGHVTFYAEAKDLDGMLEKAKRLGGRLVMPPTEAAEGTRIALFADPEGHVIGLVNSSPPPGG